MPSKFSRLKIGLDLIQMDLRNARDRNRERLRRNDIQGLNIETSLGNAFIFFRLLKKNIRDVEKLENKEKETKRKRNNSGGQNMNLTGTYGKI